MLLLQLLLILLSGNSIISCAIYLFIEESLLRDTVFRDNLRRRFTGLHIIVGFNYLVLTTFIRVCDLVHGLSQVFVYRDHFGVSILMMVSKLRGLGNDLLLVHMVVARDSGDGFHLAVTAFNSLLGYLGVALVQN